MENILENLVRVGIVTDLNADKLMCRVKYPDAGITSGWLYVLQHIDGLITVAPDNKHSHTVHDTYTGGPHPNQLQSSETFRISDGARVTCYELFSADEGLWRPVVVQTIRDQMAERGWDNYYEEYTIEALDAIFQPEQFYLTEEGIVWYFQNYDLAPYAAGIQEFTVPYGVLQEMLS